MASRNRTLTKFVFVRKGFAALVAIALVAIVSSIPRAGAAGYLDTSFGTAGKVTTNISPSQESLNRLAVQTDGKIIATGNSGGSVYLVRYHNGGGLDTSFGTGGLLNTMDELGALAIQADGKILLAGGPGFAVSRRNADGSIDASFGIGGRASTTVGSSSSANDLAIQPDGKIVVAGYSNGPVFDEDFAVVRFNSNGTLDTTFGNGGKVSTNVVGFVDFVNGVAVQADGKIVASGVGSGATLASSNFATVRYNSNGSLDSGFGSNGIVVTDFFNNFDLASDVAIQNDGKIVVVGEAGHSAADASQDDFGIARYNDNGSLDTTFGGTGKLTTDFSGRADQARGVATQADGSIVVAGHSDIINLDFLVARYTANGSLDPNFGDAGKVSTDFFGNGDTVSGLEVQPDGKILVSGQAVVSIANTVDSDFALARYYETGQSAPPKLLIDPNSDRGVAVDSVTMVRDPFTVSTSNNLSSDARTRLALLATSADLLPGETSAVVTAQAEDAAHLIHALPVEVVRKVQNNFWFTQIVVKLPDDLAHAGDVQIGITLRGVASNKVPIRIN